MPGARSILSLGRVTTFVGGPLLEIRGGKMGSSGVVPFEVHTDECLLAGVPFAGRPLVELNGIEADELNSVLEWKVEKPTRYANFEDGTNAMVLRPAGDGSMEKDWDWDRWFAFAREPATAGKRLGKVVFAQSPRDISHLGTMKPKDIEFQDNPGDEARRCRRQLESVADAVAIAGTASRRLRFMNLAS